MRPPAPLDVICFGAMLGLSSCALTPRGMARDMASAAPPAAIRSTLHALGDDENQRLLLALLANPELRAAARELAGDLTEGALAGVARPIRVERIERATERYIATLTRAVSRGLSTVLRESLASAMREAMREEHQRDLERMAAGFTRAAVEAGSRAAAEGLRRDLAPSLRDALLDARTTAALSATARTLARGVVLGSNEAMTQLQQQQARTGRPSFLASLSSLTHDGVRLVQAVALAAVALSLLLGVWVLRLILRGRRVRAESERHAETARALAEAVRAAEGRPWSKELTELIQQRLAGDPVEGMIDAVLATRAAGAKRPRRA